MGRSLCWSIFTICMPLNKVHYFSRALTAQKSIQWRHLSQLSLLEPEQPTRKVAVCWVGGFDRLNPARLGTLACHSEAQSKIHPFLSQLEDIIPPEGDLSRSKCNEAQAIEVVDFFVCFCLLSDISETIDTWTLIVLALYSNNIPVLDYWPIVSAMQIRLTSS